MVATRDEGDGGLVRVKEVQYMVTKEDVTLGGGHAMQYTDDVSWNCMLETYINLLTNVTQYIQVNKQTNKY